MLKRVVAIFEAGQKLRKSPGMLAGDGDLGDLEGIQLGVMNVDSARSAARPLCLRDLL